MTDMAGAPGAVWAFAEHEHRGLIRGINHIHEVACDIAGWLTPELMGRVLDILGWVDRELEPHISWEDGWLYPEIDARTGTPWATRSARFDHRQIREMAARLRVDWMLVDKDGGHERMAELRCHLFGLEALLRAHIEREERFLIPLLADVAPAGAEPPVEAHATRQTG